MVTLYECKKCGVLRLDLEKMKDHVVGCQKDYTREFSAVYPYINKYNLET